MVVYVIRCRVDGREYVGTTVQPLSSRLASHKQRARDLKTRSPLHAAIREHGWGQFVAEVVATASTYDEMLSIERDEIAARKTLAPHGFNLVRGGRGNLGWRMSEDTRRQIAHKALGREPWNKGKTTPDSVRAKQSAAKIGRLYPAVAAANAARAGAKASESTKARMRAAHSGKPKSEAWKAAMRGRTLTPSTRALVAEAKRLWWATRTPEQRAAQQRAVRAGQSKNAALVVA